MFHPALVSSASSSQPNAEIHQLAANAEARVLAQFEQTLTSEQSPVNDTCMDYIGFDVDPDLTSVCDEDTLCYDSDLDEDQLQDVQPENDFLYQALVDEGYSWGDLERRFGLLPKA